MFKGKSIYIRAVRDIAEGNAITLSYVDMTLSTIQRKNLLKVLSYIGKVWVCLHMLTVSEGDFIGSS